MAILDYLDASIVVDDGAGKANCAHGAKPDRAKKLERLNDAGEFHVRGLLRA
jgi:hypothetical protein